MTEPHQLGDVFEQLFEFTPDPIVVVADSGEIVQVNVAAEKVFGWPRSELEGRFIEVLVPPEIEPRHEALRNSYWDEPRERRLGIGMELSARRRDGTLVPVEIALKPLEVRGRRLVLALVRDISERKLAELALKRSHATLEHRVRERTAELSAAVQQLRAEVRERELAQRRLAEEQAKLIQAEKLSSIGMLASGVAHEINNPLSGMKSCLRALRQNRVPEGKRDQYFDTVEDALDRMGVIVRGLLDYARQRAPRSEPLDVAEIACASLRLLEPVARKRGVAARCAAEPGETRVLADRAQVMQALVNVVMNAIQATPEGGEVTISTCTGRDGLRGIRVEDTGSGIPDDVRARVCDPFFTTKPEGEGTGLGMAVTLGIVNAQGGDLELGNRPSRGAAVTIWLPEAGDA